MKKMLQTRIRHSSSEADWRNDRVFKFNQYGEPSGAAEKFLMSIDRDRHAIRWVAV